LTYNVGVSEHKLNILNDWDRYIVHATEETLEDPAYEADPETYKSDSDGSETEEEDEKVATDSIKTEDLGLAVRKMELEEGKKTVRSSVHRLKFNLPLA
jgi:hypothetical protein